ncbi:MAG: hypothetical protein AAGH38_07310 [Pseudomonadota bacterium]
MRISLIILCVVLFAAAAGRYSAEASTQALDRKISKLELQKARQERSIQMLTAEVAMLETPARLQQLAEEMTDLAPPSSDRLLAGREFFLAFGSGPNSLNVLDDRANQGAPDFSPIGAKPGPIAAALD